MKAKEIEHKIDVSGVIEEIFGKDLHHVGSQNIKLYAKHWKIELYFRDLKNGRYGYGME